MSLLDQLVDTDVLKINRSTDFDHFRGIERVGDVRSIPLDLKGFAASFATVALKSSAIHLQRTFPRILQGTYRSSGAIVAFAMDETVSATLNGAPMDLPAVMLSRGNAPCEVLESRSNLFAILNFDVVDARDWPGRLDSALLIPTRAADLDALRALTRDVFTLASRPGSFVEPHLIENLEESLLQAVDRVMQAMPEAAGRRSNLTQYLALVRTLDEYLAFNAARTLYSADIASELGVSVRTLHNAVTTIRGMSLHRYVRLKRLWNVRQQLVLGPSATVIKSIAQANGFWHMGEFGSLYRMTFGETPQQTLAAARDRRN